MERTERRHDPARTGGWTPEIVVLEGLGDLGEARDGFFLVRVEGRAAGPEQFLLTGEQYELWRRARDARRFT